MNDQISEVFDEEADMRSHGRFIVRLVKDTLNTPHIVYPPMVEGQCHWEIGGHIVNAAPECEHKTQKEGKQ